MQRSELAETTLTRGPITGPLQDVTEWDEAFEEVATSVGHRFGTERQPAGVLILANGVAVVEIVPPEGPPQVARGAFDFGSYGGSPGGPERVVTCYRIGPGDHLEVPGASRQPGARVATVHGMSDCEWIFVPLEPPTGGPAPVDPYGRHPVLGPLADRRFLERQGLVERLTRFPLLSGLSYDAVRFVASFFRVARYGPGERLYAVGDTVRPTLVLAGRVTGSDGSHGPGSVLFQDDLTHDPAALPTIATSEIVAQARVLTAELPAGLSSRLVFLDPRALMALDDRRRWPWVVVMGGGEGEAAPDAQTVALNLAAREGADLSPSAGEDVATPVLVVDADYESLERRAPPHLISKIDFDPNWSTWGGPQLAFDSKIQAGIVGLDFPSFQTIGDVEKMVARVDKWLKGQDVYKKIYFRLPRNPGFIWSPVLARAFRIQVTTDDLLDPLPALVPPLADVLRIVRAIPDQPFRVVSRVPYFTLPRTPAPTDDFWRTGVPWIYTQE